MASKGNSAPDLVIHGGKVATLDPADRIVRAVAVKGDRLLAVGSDAEIIALAGAETRRIDARGRLVTPGLIDGHAHMDREGLKEALPSLAGCRSIDDVLQRIAELVRVTPVGEWIVTMPIGDPPFYEGVPAVLAENRFPNRQDLDRVAPDHPVYIRAIWGHWRNSLPLVSIANTKALQASRITRDTMAPSPHIQIEKDSSSGAPTGCLYESVYKPLVEKTLLAGIPRFTLEERIAGLRRSMQVYNSTGTTSVFEGHGIAGEVLAAYQDLRAEGPLDVRASLMFSPAWPSAGIADVRDLLVDWGRWLTGRGLGDDYLRMAGIYTESNVSPENQLRALCGPYTGWAGFNFDSCLPEDVMVEMMVEAARNGIRVGSFDPKILALYEQVNKRVAITEQRWIIEHVGIFDADEIARLRDLGVVLQAYSNRWIYQEGEEHRTSLGEARASRVLPMRALIDAGVHVSLATDNVPPTMFDPIWHVVARRPRDGDTVLAPDQRISRIEALAAASREGAWLSQEEAEKGTLEPGKLADIAIFDKDLLTVDEAEIPSIKADVTITGGRIVYQNQ